MAIDLKERVRDVPDWPEQGVVFRDITPLLRDPEALDQTVHELAEWGKERRPDVVIGAEARGFILGAAIAREIGCGFVPARRPGKLPPETIGATYALEYGQNTLELHPETIRKGDRVLIHDDVLATGGTVAATVRLVDKAGAVAVGASVLMDLSFLPGRDAIGDLALTSLLTV